MERRYQHGLIDGVGEEGRKVIPDGPLYVRQRFQLCTEPFLASHYPGICGKTPPGGAKVDSVRVRP
jgi:hypothetical protein